MRTLNNMFEADPKHSVQTTFETWEVFPSWLHRLLIQLVFRLQHTVPRAQLVDGHSMAFSLGGHLEF